MSDVPADAHEEGSLTPDLIDLKTAPNLRARQLDRQPKTVRVVSQNVYNSSPSQEPAPFTRIWRALNPDIMLLQEWDEVDSAELLEWFSTHLPDRGPWYVRQSAGRGVAVVSRYPLTRFGPYRLTLADPTELVHTPLANRYFGSTVAYVGVTAEVPSLGKLTLASVHLTALGGADSHEDRRRVREAKTIREVLAHRQSPGLIVAGDLNLIGSQDPLQSLRHQLDRENLDLFMVDCPVVGCDQQYTWRNTITGHQPGRLDWMLYTASELVCDRSFVVDSAQLCSEDRAYWQLEETDSRFSDHLPVTADFHLNPHGPRGSA